MLFRRHHPLYGPLSHHARKAYLIFAKGDGYQAYQAFVQCRQQVVHLLSQPADALFWDDVLTAAGKTNTGNALIKIASRYFPKHPGIQLRWLGIRTQRENLRDSLAHAEAMSSLCSNTYEHTLQQAIVIRISARMGLIKSTYERIAHLKTQLPTKHYLAWRHLAIAYGYLRDWDAAITCSQQAIKSYPQRADGYCLLISNLLARSQLAQAKKVLQQAITKGFNDLMFLHYKAQFYYFIGDLTQSIQCLTELKHRWSNMDLRQIEHTHVNLLWLNDQKDKALKLAQTVYPSFYQQLKEAPPNAEKVLISVPVMCQEPSMCVPTSITMCAHSQGVTLDPRQLYQQMQGHEGTELWRMQSYLENNGFTVHHIQNTSAAIKTLLKQGIPLIGHLLTLFMAHVEVIIGFDDALQGFYIRDPESLSPKFVDEGYVTEAYQASGNYLIAVTHQSQSALTGYPCHKDAQQLIALSKHVAENNINLAKLAYQKISHDSPCAYLRDIYAYGICLSPQQFADRMKHYANDQQQHNVTRLKAILNCGDTEFLEQWVDSYRQQHDDIPTGFAHYLELIVAKAKQHWSEVLTRANQLLAKSPSAEHLWIYKAEAEYELGLMDDALSSANMAIDLSPKSTSIKRKLRLIRPYAESYQARCQQLQAQIKASPSIFELQEEYAYLLGEGSSGLEYEKALKRCIDARPLLPWNYDKLADWYLQQDRNDLAKTILNQGRSLLPTEIQLRSFEQDKEDTPHPKSEDHDQQATPEVSLTDQWQMLKWTWYQQAHFTDSDYQRLATLIENNDFINQLSWFDACYCYAVYFGVTDQRLRQRSASEQTAALKKCLPADLPGHKPFSLLCFNQALERGDLSRQANYLLYEWQSAAMKNGQWRYDIAFDIAFFKECAGYLNDAEQMYQTIIQQMPGYAGAYYRLAQILDKKGELQLAMHWYTKSIEIAPLSPGAISRMLDVYHDNQLYEKAALCAQKLLDLHPYSFNYIEQVLRYLAYNDSVKVALQQLEDYEVYLSPSAKAAIAARLYLIEDNFQQAADQLATINQRQGLTRHVMVSEVRCYIGLEKYEQALNTIHNALEYEPEDEWFINTKLQVLEKTNSTQRYTFIEHCIKQQVITNNILSSWYEYHKHDNSETLFDWLQQQPEDAAYRCARYLEHVFIDHNELQKRLDLLYFGSRYFTHYDYFKRTLVYWLINQNKYDEAVQITKTLLAQQPDEPENHLLLGRIYTDQGNVSVAFQHLNRAYDMTGWVDALVHIGRAHHSEGNTRLAIDTYKNVLEKDPLHDLALNNLFILHYEPTQLYPYFYRTIDHQIGHETQYFLVNAARCAVEVKQPLPTNWLPMALHRFNELFHEPPFADEKTQLAKLIYRYYFTLGEKEKGEAILDKAEVPKPGFWPWHRFGNSWIPKHESYES
ncbi:tetratricopeptide repeat protein [Zooshikella marina]|uniref:tetratricopeptide repeat protein n=1 Tax=Zooshikella ganghwensis TaxID=202772 RepID=UPI001BAE5ED4|nr:tetratricopeptide repeat protein [Zooshikella ganghwensis]MBU2705102.1 tetratricopeptide repeat protein [Zooshikella ganghwensis]